ncbi:MAG: hypothetical protein IJH13_03100 [Bacilli bacterium]|nr:hypothetical protein [Bacilli bacterium]
MRDAIGGIVNIQIILVFIVLVSGYLAFSVNYTKAFRAKNKIINAIEQYEGMTDNASLAEDGDTATYLKQIGYSGRSNCPTGYNADPYQLGFCWRETQVDTTNTALDKRYFSVMTFINIDIPIIEKILDRIEPFKIKGDTKLIITHKK